MAARIAEIKGAHAKERQELEKALKRSSALGFGVFCGVGYTISGEVQGVIGVGLVWKVF